MGFFYSLPRNEIWDSLGALSARLPSALGSLFLMLMIGDTLFCWPQKGDKQFFTPIVASLGFALSPLIIIWSRTAVSDALLTGTLGISLLSFWRRMGLWCLRIFSRNHRCVRWCKPLRAGKRRRSMPIPRTMCISPRSIRNLRKPIPSTARF